MLLRTSTLAAGWSCWICRAPRGAIGLISRCLCSALGTHGAVLQLTVMSQSCQALRGSCSSPCSTAGRFCGSQSQPEGAVCCCWGATSPDELQICRQWLLVLLRGPAVCQMQAQSMCSSLAHSGLSSAHSSQGFSPCPASLLAVCVGEGRT